MVAVVLQISQTTVNCGFSRIHALNQERAAENARREQENAQRIERGEHSLPSLKLLAMGTGLRRGEIRRLRRCDVELSRERISIPAASAKSRRAQTVDLHPALVPRLGSPSSSQPIPGGHEG